MKQPYKRPKGGLLHVKTWKITPLQNKEAHSDIFDSNSFHMNLETKVERSGRTPDWLFIICTLDVMKQGRLEKFTPHKRKIPFLWYPVAQPSW